jgi:hypothetical protein
VTRLSRTIGVCPTALVMSLSAPRIMVVQVLARVRARHKHACKTG